MSNFDCNDNPQKKIHSKNENFEVLQPSTKTTNEEKSSQLIAEVVETAIEAVEENPSKEWMQIAAPIMKSGGKSVAIILSLGFVAIPLTVFGSPWIGIILATGATITAICSCLR
ncbi:hypothetical protein [Scytonema sp. PCC 10023]|uniref:hypothetical protein n=1 Tax=Scytonema sp. PCC 10023 TaxID=1680591 RepID=UPI0039C70412